jgi:hypothetical protein
MIVPALSEQSSSAYVRSVEPFVSTTVAGSQIADRPRSKWQQVVAALQPLRSLKPDWDGFGAAAPSLGVIYDAVRIAQRFGEMGSPPPTAVVPTPAGSILFAWEGAEYLEIEVRAPHRAEWMLVDEKGVASHGVIHLAEKTYTQAS